MEKVLFDKIPPVCSIAHTTTKMLVTINVRPTQVGEEYEVCEFTYRKPVVTLLEIVLDMAKEGVLLQCTETEILQIAESLHCDNAETLKYVRQAVLQLITDYDKSDNINTFFFNDSSMWLSIEERKNLRQSLSVLEAKGIDSFTYWNDLTPITLPVSRFKDILDDIELYAMQTFNVTSVHKSQLANLQSVSDILDFDYKQGYPDWLIFTT